MLTFGRARLRVIVVIAIIIVVALAARRVEPAPILLYLTQRVEKEPPKTREPEKCNTGQNEVNQRSVADVTGQSKVWYASSYQ